MSEETTNNNDKLKQENELNKLSDMPEEEKEEKSKLNNSK